MNVGYEWIVDAAGCDPAALRDLGAMRALLDRIVSDLALKPVGEPLWHAFGGEAGVTGLILLSESHLACHTYPEFGAATFNLYCCRERPDWPWSERLAEAIGATRVSVSRIERSVPLSAISSLERAG